MKKKCHIAFLMLLPLCVVVLSIVMPAAYPQANTTLLSGWLDWSDPANMLARNLNKEAIELLDGRAGRIRALTTQGDWEKRQNEVRAVLHRIVGPFPERTPLNARITGTVQKGDFRVEKIVFESRPGFFVTGALFIPANLAGKAPAILNPIGHTAEAFRHPLYQDLILNLVHKGFIVFSYDPPGQGERLQYYNPETGNSDVGGSTTEHSYVGFQCLLAGSNIARYMIWDGMRAVDYLLTRPEVDGSRIGVTGLSGGGTQSSYLGAFDERILAAAPTCYITGFRRLLASIGPQDAEQNFPAGIKNGIDHADLLEIRAPKPTLLIATTRDFFSIQGARETAAEVEKAFAAFGHDDHFAIAEDDFEHGYTAGTREAICRFFQEALESPGEPGDRKYPYLTYEELRITPTGQVKTALGSKNIFDLNKSDAFELVSGLDASRNNADSHLVKVTREALRLSGFTLPSLNQPAVFRGRERGQGYSIEKYVLDSGEGIPIPLLLFLPDGAGPHPSVIYCDSRGKARDAGPDGIIQWLLRKGHCVAAADLSGTGETEDGRTIFNPFRALQAGRSIPGIQAADILRVFYFLKSRADIRKDEIAGIAVRDAGPALLHAAVFGKEIRKICLIESLTSYKSLVLNPRYDYDLALMIPSVLTAYDLPDLMAALAPRPVLLVNAADNSGLPAPQAWVEDEVAFARHVYAARGAENALTILSRDETMPPEAVLGSWLAR